ncbi:argonaute/piwi family protein [Hymenobacter mucosus]|uniref:Piwi domain-containing protein n=1 Tax=Hymenobacter mucosus TaxID=1411120 RepID=A0A239AVL5_9BACT|nr:hypothetical protein [Hymenobacter mucosus]SNR99372.1 hypothetical protein SAMN06269173_11558 [Hymenobacter mucosus]
MDIKIIEIQPTELEFGGIGSFTDPKVGLKQAGPFDVRFGAAQLKEVRVGLVGPREMNMKAAFWLERCQGLIPTTMKNTQQYPDYPGFGMVFQATLNTSTVWTHEIASEELTDALAIQDDSLRFDTVLNLYNKGLEKLSTLESTRPNVIFCCLPENLVDACHHVERKLTKDEKSELKKMASANKPGFQFSLFDEQIEDTEEDLLYRDFRRALKAKAILVNIPIQIGRDKIFLDLADNQDAAARAWNSSVALYYKAGGIPWRLRAHDVETCFVGITFHHLRTNIKQVVKSCIAQGFSSDGEGFALRGSDVEYNPRASRAVHLSSAQSFELGVKIIEEYAYRTGLPPQRIVLHKTSFFDENEEEGFRNAFSSIPIVELINLQETAFCLVKHSKYPVDRGTLCVVNDTSYYLFNTGYIRELGTYPGAHIPRPIEIRSNEPLDVVKAAEDILALARMNWNTSSFTGGAPVTLSFSRQVGGIMAELNVKNIRKLPTSFRFYI